MFFQRPDGETGRHKRLKKTRAYKKINGLRVFVHFLCLIDRRPHPLRPAKRGHSIALICRHPDADGYGCLPFSNRLAPLAPARPSALGVWLGQIPHLTTFPARCISTVPATPDNASAFTIPARVPVRCCTSVVPPGAVYTTIARASNRRSISPARYPRRHSSPRAVLRMCSGASRLNSLRPMRSRPLLRPTSHPAA